MNDKKETQSETKKSRSEAYLQLNGVSKIYGKYEAVKSLDLTIGKGELVALLGPSGCGKTTTLRMIAGLVSTTSGRILVDGVDLTTVAPHGRDMGLVFQNYALFPHMTVEKNVAFGLEMRSIGRDEIRKRVKDALAMVQLDHLAQRRPRELSGGQQQRVALARALVIRPSILLLDEPLSNLDAKLRDEMRIQIRDIQQKLGITTVFVTHDQIEALSMCDRVVVMHDGRIEQVGTPYDVYERPQSSFVASFVGRTVKLAGTAQSGSVIKIGKNIIRSSSAIAEGPVDVMIRPHRINITFGEGPSLMTGGDVNSLSGVLSKTTFVGDVIQFHVNVAGDEVIAEAATDKDHTIPALGHPVSLSWKVGDTMVFGRM